MLITRTNILNFLKIKQIEKDLLICDYKINEGNNILYSSFKKGKMTFDKWLNQIYYLDLNQEKNFPIKLNQFNQGIYISLGTLQKNKKYAKKYDYGILFLFDDLNIKKIKNNEISEDIICNPILIQFNQELFQKAILVED